MSGKRKGAQAGSARPQKRKKKSESHSKPAKQTVAVKGWLAQQAANKKLVKEIAEKQVEILSLQTKNEELTTRNQTLIAEQEELVTNRDAFEAANGKFFHTDAIKDAEILSLQRMNTEKEQMIVERDNRNEEHENSDRKKDAEILILKQKNTENDETIEQKKQEVADFRETVNRYTQDGKIRDREFDKLNKVLIKKTEDETKYVATILNMESEKTIADNEKAMTAKDNTAKDKTIKEKEKTIEGCQNAMTDNNRTIEGYQRAAETYETNRKKNLVADAEGRQFYTNLANEKENENEKLTEVIICLQNTMHHEDVFIDALSKEVDLTVKLEIYKVLKNARDLTRCQQFAVFKMLVKVCMGQESDVEDTGIDSINEQSIGHAWFLLSTRNLNSNQACSFPQNINKSPSTYFEGVFEQLPDSKHKIDEVRAHMVYVWTETAVWRQGWISFAVKKKFKVNTQTGIDIKTVTPKTLLTKSKYFLVSFALGDFKVCHVKNLWMNDHA